MYQSFAKAKEKDQLKPLLEVV